MDSGQARHKILVVDDTPDNVRLLIGFLRGQGYKVLAAPNGRRALTTAQMELPNLILLDIRMPDMDGYEVCRILKADERTREIPVIFLSALSEEPDKVTGFEVGGVDYITKPFKMKEVLVRVKTHVTLQSLHADLQAQNTRLLQEISQRKQAEKKLQDLNLELEKANRNKDAFFSILAHDLRSPFSAFVNLTKGLIGSLEKYDRAELDNLFQQIHASAKQLYELLNNLLTWSRLGRGLLEPEPQLIDLVSMTRAAIYILRANAERKGIEMQNLLQEGSIVYADYNMTDTVVRNLLSNALKFTGPGGVIRISARIHRESVDVVISDTGVGISPARQEKLFRIDAKTSTTGTAGEKGTGLGLILCKDLVEANGGSIRLESEPGQGSAFIFTLPKGDLSAVL